MPDAPAPRQSRQTRQKQAIMESLNSGRVLSMEDILEAAREAGVTISERTVFRQLKELMAEQRIVRVYLPGEPARYEVPTYKHRPHFICRLCEQVHVLPVETPDIIPLIPLPPGFEAHGEEVILYGHCPDCTQAPAEAPPEPAEGH
jgi:Fur family ferric uptake transcriptional regulator